MITETQPTDLWEDKDTLDYWAVLNAINPNGWYHQVRTEKGIPAESTVGIIADIFALIQSIGAWVPFTYDEVLYWVTKHAADHDKFEEYKKTMDGLVRRLVNHMITDGLLGGSPTARLWITPRLKKILLDNATCLS